MLGERLRCERELLSRESSGSMQVFAWIPRKSSRWMYTNDHQSVCSKPLRFGRHVRER